MPVADYIYIRYIPDPGKTQPGPDHIKYCLYVLGASGLFFAIPGEGICWRPGPEAKRKKILINAILKIRQNPLAVEGKEVVTGKIGVFYL